jgi:hypothetical protein
MSQRASLLGYTLQAHAFSCVAATSFPKDGVGKASHFAPAAALETLSGEALSEHPPTGLSLPQTEETAGAFLLES